MGRLRFTLACCAGLSALAAAPAQAAKFNVTSKADSGSGTLRQALMDAGAASGPDIVKLKVTGSIKLSTSALAVDSDVDIKGPGADVLKIKRDPSAPMFRIFEISPGITASIRGVTITGGHTAPAGNSTTGGGVFNQGALTLDGVVVSGNVVAHTEAMDPGLALGGGVMNYGGSLVVRNSTITNNEVDGVGPMVSAEGGGIYNIGTATVDVENSTVAGNRATPGSGATAKGGGIYTVGTFTIASSTLAMNTGVGSNLFVSGAIGTVKSTILATPEASQSNCGGTGASNSIGFNLISDSSCGFVQPTDLMADPLLKQLGDNGGPTPTMALSPGSPAIDQGLSTGLPQDQRGKPRFDFGSIPNATGGDGSDIGAYERQH